MWISEFQDTRMCRKIWVQKMLSSVVDWCWYQVLCYNFGCLIFHGSVAWVAVSHFNIRKTTVLAIHYSIIQDLNIISNKYSHILKKLIVEESWLLRVRYTFPVYLYVCKLRFINEDNQRFGGCVGELLKYCKIFESVK